MWNWGGDNGFDVDTGSTQNIHSQYAFKHQLGPGMNAVDHIMILSIFVNYCPTYFRDVA